jgi:hypothetical protein
MISGTLRKNSHNNAKDRQARERRGDPHLDEHLVAEGVLRDRQPRDVPFPGGAELGRGLRGDRLDLARQPVALVLVQDGHVDRGGAAVAGRERVLQQRQALDVAADRQARLGRLGRRRHQPLEADRAGAGLVDVVGDRQRHQVPGHDPLELEDALGGPVQGAERGGVVDAVRVLGLDEADDDGVVQRHLVLHLVVENPVGLLGREHVLRVGVDLDPGDLQPEDERQQQREQVDQPRAAQGEFQQCLFQLRLSISGPTRGAPGGTPLRTGHQNKLAITNMQAGDTP